MVPPLPSTPNTTNARFYLGRAYAAALLLENGANVNAANRQGVTALHCAAHHGNMDCLALLLKYKADPLAVTAQLET